MKVVVSEKSSIERELEVSVEKARVQQSFDKHLRELVQSINIPGFRKGKAPRNIIMRYANQEQLQRSVFEDVGLPAYRQAIQQEKLAPLGDPNVELVQLEHGKDLIFKATIEIFPTIELADEDYLGIEVEVPQLAVADDDVMRELEDLREKATRTVTVDEDRGLEEGDVAVVDFEARDGDTLVPDGSGENFQMLVDDSLFIPGFSSHLHGLKVDEKREFDFAFPDDYKNNDLAGKNIHFNFTLKTIKKRELPEMDDDFAKEVSKFSTLEELKADTRTRMERVHSLDTGNRGLTHIAKTRTDIPVPKVFSNNVIMHTLEGQARQLQQYGIKFEDYLRQQGIEVQQLFDSMRPGAELSARAEMLLQTIAKKHDIKVSDEELDTELKLYAEAQNREFDEVKAEMLKHEQTENFRASVVRQRVVEMIAEKAKLVEMKAPEAGEGAASEEAEPAAAEEKAPAAEEKAPAAEEAEAPAAAPANEQAEAPAAEEEKAETEAGQAPKS